MFDFKTHIRNNKGKVVQENHYNMKIAEGVRTFERPVKSGLWYYENGTPTPETLEKLKVDTLKAAQAQRDAEAAMKLVSEEQNKKEKAAAEKDKVLTLQAAEIAKLKEQLEKATASDSNVQAGATQVASNKKS